VRRRTNREHRYVLRDVRVISRPHSAQRFYLEVRTSYDLRCFFISPHRGKIPGWQVENIARIHDSPRDAFCYAVSLRRN
jgi:hypothetical protein